MFALRSSVVDTNLTPNPSPLKVAIAVLTAADHEPPLLKTVSWPSFLNLLNHGVGMFFSLYRFVRASDIRKLLYRDHQRKRDRFIVDRANEYGVITSLFQTDLIPSAAFLAEQHHLAEP